MSQYECIWDRIKKLPKQEAETQGIKIIAHRALQSRIVKAVQKRKLIDVGYKLLLGNNHARLSVFRKGAEVTFFLTIYPPAKVTSDML